MKRSALIITVLIVSLLIASTVISTRIIQEKETVEKALEKGRAERARALKASEARYKEYAMISQIWEDFFEENLTSLEIEKRKQKLLENKEIIGKNYKLYVRLLDITEENGHKIVKFYESAPGKNSLIPIRCIFYDDNKVIPDDIKRKSYLDIDAKLIGVGKSTVDKDYIDMFLNITKILDYGEKGKD